LTGSTFAQAQVNSTIEVEAQGTITFSPDSFVVKLYMDYSSVNYSDRLPEEGFPNEIVEMPVDMEVSEMEYATVVESDEPPPVEEVKSPEQLRNERERYRRVEDSLQALREIRLLEFKAKLITMGVQFPKRDSERSGYSYRSNSWVQNLSPAQYGKIDSLSRIYGHPLHLEMVDIKMKDHSVLKERAYRQAIENSKKEADILAKAMGRKVGKMSTVKTEAIDLMDLVPLMLRKEIQREVRKSDRFMQPALYQLSQELGSELFEKDRYDDKKIVYWTWTEKIHVTYQLN
jgi:hypothetical protein